MDNFGESDTCWESIRSTVQTFEDIKHFRTSRHSCFLTQPIYGSFSWCLLKKTWLQRPDVFPNAPMASSRESSEISINSHPSLHDDDMASQGRPSPKVGFIPNSSSTKTSMASSTSASWSCLALLPCWYKEILFTLTERKICLQYTMTFVNTNRKVLYS